MERVIRSGRFTMGAEVEAAEAELAAYHGRKHCIMVNSGSSANLIAVAALDIIRDMKYEVIAPALAWPTTYSPFIQYDREFHIQDCDETWNLSYKGLLVLDVGSLESVDAVVVANILGIPGYIGGIKRWCDDNGKMLIEDNCESLGARYDDKLCGTFGLVSTLSFYHSHQISAIEGGAVLTDADALAKACRMLRNHGWTKGVDKPKKFQDEYKFVHHGYNVRPLEMHAAILREQLKKVDDMAKRRRDNYYQLRELADSFGLGLPAIADPKGINPFNFSFLCEDGDQRDYMVGKLRQRSIDCRPVVGGSYLCQPYQSGVLHVHDTPVADSIHYRGISIGIPLSQTVTEVLADSLTEVFEEAL